MTLNCTTQKDIMTAHNNSAILVKRYTHTFEDSRVAVIFYYSHSEKENLRVCLEDEKATRKIARFIRALEKDTLLTVRTNHSTLIRALMNVSVRTHDMMLAEKCYEQKRLEKNLNYTRYALECCQATRTVETNATLLCKLRNIETFLQQYASEIESVLRV